MTEFAAHFLIQQQVLEFIWADVNIGGIQDKFQEEFLISKKPDLLCFFSYFIIY